MKNQSIKELINQRKILINQKKIETDIWNKCVLQVKINNINKHIDIIKRS